MILFLQLLLVHLIADFYIQRKSWIESKVKYKEKSLGLFKHILTHLILNALVLYFNLGFSAMFVIALLFIVLSHYAIDIWKTYQGFYLQSFLVDQIGHIVVLALVAAYVAQPDLTLWLHFIEQHFAAELLVFPVVFLLAYTPVSLIIQLILRPYTNAIEKDNALNHASNQGLPFAGEWIGVLERFLIISFVLLGQYAGIGFLLAAKSVFRFGDMRREQDRKLTEYIMLGTLFSVTIALALGLMAKYGYSMLAGA